MKASKKNIVTSSNLDPNETWIVHTVGPDSIVVKAKSDLSFKHGQYEIVQS